MSWADLLPVAASMALVVGTVVTNLRTGSTQAQHELVNTLKDRIDTLESHITDLEATVKELRAELAQYKTRKK